MYFAGTWRTKEDDVFSPLNVYATGKLQHFLSVHGAAQGWDYRQQDILKRIYGSFDQCGTEYYLHTGKIISFYCFITL
jgi:hypothetical protein